MTEPFTQWVVEDRFTAGRPDLAAAGVELVNDVKPFELMKLRLLNASHSALAYLGYLAGYETIADTMQDPHFARLAAQVREEAAVTLTMPGGTDLAAYRASLLKRFANPALHHRTWQIAMDGSQKLPQRLLGTVRDRLKAGAPIGRLALGIAGWMRYATGVDERGRPIDVRDPLSERLLKIGRESGLVAERLAPAYLRLREIFGDDLPADPRFTEPVMRALAALIQSGAKRTVAGLSV
jgi:fructuronate reductase